jgi:tetratricopeptide (TPR) repeat protein
MAQASILELLEAGVQHHRAGRRNDAEICYRRILAAEPNNDSALNLLGVIAQETGHSDAAVHLITRAIAINPNIAGYHNNLGNALRDLKHLTEANKCYRQAIRIDPSFALAHYNLGNTLIETEDFTALDESIAASREAIRLKPDYVEAMNNLGVALRKKGRIEESMDLCRRALELKPDFAEAHNSTGNLYKQRHEMAHAIKAYRRAIELKPDFGLARYNLAIALLLLGDFENGWPEHEWRLKNEPNPRIFPRPRWTGEDLHGKTILLWGEQGIGDNFQFVRYAPLVAQRGANVIVQVRSDIVRLLQSNPALGQIITAGDDIRPYDFHCPLMSLPLIFRTSLADVPANVPYFFPEPALIESWKQKLAPADGRLRVGLVWAGNPDFKDDRTRSLHLRQLAPFADARNVKFYSLQKGAAEHQAAQPPAGLELIDLGPELKDFADSAAVISLMDLIVTTDTSMPHLAGALAKPVWLMLQFAPDFRWLLERQDSPWYPTMRLFRQPSLGDWSSVIRNVVEALANVQIRATPP